MDGQGERAGLVPLVQLVAAGLRKITAESGEPVYLVIIDEYAYFSATVGTKPNREEFSALVRDLVARGRAAGVIVILATQRPSHQVIDPSLRDLFGYRWAFRCTTDSSSDTVLGHGWAGQGYTAATIDPLARGVSWLLAETGIPRRIKTAYLTDDQIKFLAAYAAFARRIVRAYARRISTGDIDALADITILAADIDNAIGHAVTGLRETGYSWAEIGARLGVTRQAAQQRWGGTRP